MSARQVSAEAVSGYYTEDEERIERADILAQLHRFARCTGAAPGDDVVRHFDGRLRSALERREHAARNG